MRNLNEGKKKASAYMAELAEIDKQSAVVAMEAKINKLAEMEEAKTQRLSMVHEDENLSELIDKKRVKMMEREIKEIEKAKLKLEKLYEKMTGDKKKEVVKEDPSDEDMDHQDALDKASAEGSTEFMEEGGYDSTYEEDDTIDEAGNIDSDQEPKSFLKKTPYSSMEEVSRWQKLAGLE